MNTIRTGKIARLPKPIRDELNTRLDRAESGPTLAAWLNTLPDVQKVLAEHFAGRPINLQNISEWRNGGYQDYLQVQADQTLTRQLAEHSRAMENMGDEIPDGDVISEAFMTITAADFVRTARVLLKETKTAKERWAVLCDINTQFTRLRREDCRIGHLKIRQDKSDAAKAAAAKAAETEQRRQYLTYFELEPPLMDLRTKFCGDEKAYGKETFILELRHNLPVDFLSDSKPPNQPATNPAPAQTPASTPANNSPSPQPALEPIPPIQRSINPPPHQASDQAPIKPQTASKTPDIRVHQTPAESFENPRQTPNSPGPSSRPTCQPAIGNSSNSQPEAPAYPESLLPNHP